MILAKRLKGKAISAWLGPTGDKVREAVARARDTITKAPRKLELYIDIADPWSYLVAQATKRLLEHYPIDLVVSIVTPPASDVDPEPKLRVVHSVRDARLLADYYDLDFAGKKDPDSNIVRDVGSSLIKNRPPLEQLDAALRLLGDLWANDKKTLRASLGVLGAESHGMVLPIINENYAALRKSGHYQGGMLHYGGEWYWGIDRLPYLEAALARDTGKPVANVVKPRAIESRGPKSLGPNPLTCEMWFSFRSPYSYLALEQIEDVLAPHAIPLVLRAVQPMVNRGARLPPVKRMYMVRDAKREADRLGIPFGTLCDPLGTGVDNCLSIFHWAAKRSQADALAFAKSAMRGIWTEALDVSEYVDLRTIVERAGLPWEEAKAAIGEPAAMKAASNNAQDLAVVSLWGVPSFRIGELVAWGQDRLPIIADQLRRHAAAKQEPAAP